jgi:hypothetical protein
MSQKDESGTTHPTLIPTPLNTWCIDSTHDDILLEGEPHEPEQSPRLARRWCILAV